MEYYEESAHRTYEGSDPSAPKTVDARSPTATPEDITLDALQNCTALESAVNFVYTLALQNYMLVWVRYMTHRRPDGSLGNDGRECVQRYLQQIVRVFLSEELCVEIVTSTLSNQWTVYPFGQTHPYISFPLRIFENEPSYAAFLAYTNRMLLTNQVDVQSPVYSAQGGAFMRCTDLHTNGRVVFTQFAYNRLLSYHFPRFQFVACFVCTLAADARVVDDKSGIEVDKAVRTDIEADYNNNNNNNKGMPPIEDLVESMRSYSNGVRVLLFTALQNLIGSFSLRMEQAMHSTRVLQEHESSIGGAGTRLPAVFAPNERRAVRMIAFFFPYLRMLTSSVQRFSLKEMNACWFLAHSRIVDKVNELYPVNFN